jgi:poly-gamma-glutamate synthesis protein (capsule biosynthesis protein)
VPVPRAQQSETGADFIGRVIDMDGKPIADAHVESQNGTATSDKDGWFRFAGEGRPQWLKVAAPGFISRTRAAMPGVPVLFRLSPDDGKTTVIHFGGDTMFARRFFDPNGDGYTADGLLPINPTVEDHLRLFAPVQPLLESADLSVLNLDSTLTDQPYVPKDSPRPASFHATAKYVYASHINSAMALKQAGVDVIDLGNNHNYDMLELGLKSSLAALDQAGLVHFGAGINESSAWAPALLSSKGQKIAFIGCTTLRIPLGTVTRRDVPFVASDLNQKGGAAYCSEAPLRAAIISAKQQADSVVVMIHGGREYDRTPTKKISYLTEIARQAGATLVINHHSHVVSGFSWKEPSLTAWSMGSFLADQTVWQSFESYLLAVYLREGSVVRAYVEPLIMDGYLPHGLTDELADYIVRGAAGRDPGPFVMESGAMEIDLDGRALQQTYTQTMDGGADPGTILAMPQAQWISGFHGTGTLRLGRDLLWVGSFENDAVESTLGGVPLWDRELGGVQIGPDYAYEGEQGIRLERGAQNTQDVVTSSAHRILVQPNTQLSITGMIRVNQSGSAFVQLSWYDAYAGPSFQKIIQPMEVKADGTWQPFRFDVRVPVKAAAIRVYLRLATPSRGTVTADFDNLRIIEWASPRALFSPLYNHALLSGAGELTFTQQILPGAEEWIILPPDAEIK